MIPVTPGFAGFDGSMPGAPQLKKAGQMAATARVAFLV